MNASPNEFETLKRLQDVWAARDPDGVALAEASGTPITYGGLLAQSDAMRAALRRQGIGVRDRVAVVIPNGADLAVAVLSVAAAAVCVPLSHECREDEFDEYFRDLNAAAVIVGSEAAAPLRRSALRHGLPIMALPFDVTRARGQGVLQLGPGAGAPDGDEAALQDTALVLHTSGTAGRPKRVALTHANLCSRVHQRVAALRLTRQDRCLNMMPAYQRSGLELVLATLASGGTVLCPPQFDADTFFACFQAFRPTWYAAVPAVQAAILSLVDGYRAALDRSSLRFIRTGTGMLPAHVLNGIERAFNAPVIQSYGMTEVGTICSNPMPQGVRKAGSVGPAAGPDVAIMDEHGGRLPPGNVGEVVVRGPNVFRGYVDDPPSTAAAFHDEWFRTGDLGSLDDDGYLFLQGRLKDLINRGGQKISPREVEDLLLEHPEVVEASVFPVPHPTLGEDVAAVVVLHNDANATEQDLRRFVALRLAGFKVPCRVLVVDEIPKETSGKTRRRDLSGHFAPLLATPFVAPAARLEEMLARVWAQELRIDRVGVHDNFFELGGDSLMATRICARLEAETGQAVSVGSLFAFPTVARLAAALGGQSTTAGSRSCVMPIRTGGSRPPLVCLHGPWGEISHYHQLARYLGHDQPVYGIQAQGADGARPVHTRIEEMAAHYVRELPTVLARGPYILCGYSAGGLVAWEVAYQLHRQGHRVALLALLDVPLYTNAALMPPRVVAQWFLRRVRAHWGALREGSLEGGLGYLTRRVGGGVRKYLGTRSPAPASNDGWHRQWPSVQSSPRSADGATPAAGDLLRAHRAARRAYLPPVYPGRVALFLTQRPDVDFRYDPRLPGLLAPGVVEMHDIPGAHDTMIAEPHVRVLATVLQECIERAIEPAPRSRLYT